MVLLKDAEIVVISPYTQTYIGDQLEYLRKGVKHIIPVIPIPRFSRLSLSLPIINQKFRYLQKGVESINDRHAPIIAPFFTIPISPLRKRHYQLISKSVLKQTRNIRPNLIHAHFSEYGFAAINLAKKTHSPVVLTVHGGDAYEFPFRSNWHYNLTKQILHNVDHIITVSHSNRKVIESLDMPREKISVIPNGFDPELFRPHPKKSLRASLDISQSNYVLLTVGNLIGIKGHQYLLDAFSVLSKRHSNLRLIIIGSGLLRAQLMKRARALGINKLVRFIGQIKHEEIPSWVNASNLFILPSLREGFPTVIPEALSCGIPVVASNIGGIPEAIRNDQVGYLVEPANVEQLINQIERAMLKEWNPDYICQYASKFSWEEISKQILSIYSKLLE